MHATLHSALRLAALVGAAGVLSGCTTYQFKVDAIKAAPDTSFSVSYRLQSAHPHVGEGDQVFQRAAQYVKTALSSKGMYEAPAATTPDLVIEIDFGLGNERTEQWLVGGMPRVAGGFHGHGVFGGGGPGRNDVVEITLFEKFLRITAREAAPRAGEHAPREVWSVYVTTEGEEVNLDKYVPLLVAAAMDAVESDTKGPRQIAFGPHDERVVFVKAGM